MKFLHNKISISKLLICLISFSTPILGQTKGAITFLNAVSLETPTYFIVDGISIKAKGFKSGFCTSALEFDATNHTVVAKNGDQQSDPIVVTPSSTASPLLVASLLLKEDKNSKEIKPKLILFSAKNLPKGKGWNYQVFYSSLKPSTDFVINGEAVNLKGGEGKNFLGVGNRFTIEAGGKPLAKYKSEDPGNFFVILYDNSDGSIGASLAPDQLYFICPK